MPSTDTLTDKAIKAALKGAVQGGKPIKVSDGAGLHLEARPTGSGWWRMRYRFDGKEGMLSLGVYPDVSLAAARERRNEVREQVAAGVDPSASRKADKAAARSQAVVERLTAEGKALPGTFEFVAREWLEVKHEREVSPGHAERTRIRFEQDAFPWIGALPIEQIEAPTILDCLRRVTARGAIETAHRLKDACGQVFRYAIATGAAKRNPAADLRDALPPVPTRHHAAVTDPAEVGNLLRAMAGYQGHPVTRAALGLSALVFLRPGEVRQLEWTWVDFDRSLIEVPPGLMKRRLVEKVNGRPHLVPLARQAVALLKDLQPLTGAGQYLFPALTSASRCMSENTIRMALRRLGYDNDAMTAHGFRAMARTLAVERVGIAAEVIEAQLAHAVAGSLGRAYDRTTFMEQRIQAMQQWADYLDRLRDGGATVLTLASTASPQKKIS